MNIVATLLTSVQVYNISNVYSMLFSHNGRQTISSYLTTNSMLNHGWNSMLQEELFDQLVSETLSLEHQKKHHKGCIP